jgi:acyl-homoserine-lactone acylase
MALAMLAACAPASAADQPTALPRSAEPQYQATIVRTAYGIPHITARDFGSLGYGYGYALASDNLCTMADGYITVEGRRSRYFGASASVPMTPFTNLQSDLFWQSVIDHHVIRRLLAIRTGAGAIGSRLRQLIRGYVAGYNRYLASVGGSAGVPDPTCRGKAWVQPITTLDAYLLIYQALDQDGQAGTIAGIATAQPPHGSVAAARATAPVTAAALTARAASVRRTAPGSAGLPSMQQLRQLGERLGVPGLSGGQGSNAIAVGSAGTSDHRHGILLGNPHYPWQGVNRFYQVQLTIPGQMNVEGATLFGLPLVIIGFTATMAWSLTVSPAWTVTPYQLALVPGHPTEYVLGGKPVAMTRQKVTVQTRSASGAIKLVHRTLWSTRYGPVIARFEGQPLPWTATTAFALADANAGNLRALSHFLATDQARSAAQELSILKRYEGLPFVNTIAADSTGHALYASILAIPDVTDAMAARCDTALGQASFAEGGPPVLDGSRGSCAWGTDKDSAAPGIFGPAEEPALMNRDFVENSNDSYWMTNPAHPLTGFPRIIGGAGTGVPGAQGGDLGLRTRSALSMIMKRISGSDGAGPPGFTFGDMKNLMFSDIQYGASLVKRQLVAMCRSFPGGLAPTSSGGTIPVGTSCRVLAAWDGREDIHSRGAVLFRQFWEGALSLPAGPWVHPFSPADPVHTPYGLDTTSTGVQQAFGDALASLHSAGLPYNVELGTVQYAVRNGRKIPLPGGPGDPDGEFNAIYLQPGVGPVLGSSYIQDVTWVPGPCGPKAATVLTYSESANPASPHYADQTELFSHRRWAAAYFCRSEVAAHAVSATTLRGR